MKITQYIEGYDPVMLKNILFCFKHEIFMKSFPYDDTKVSSLRSDARRVLKWEEMYDKPFEDITLADTFKYEKIKYTSFCNNIYIRYFNIKLIEEIIEVSTYHVSDIIRKYGCSTTKARSLTFFKYDDSKYTKRYSNEESQIYIAMNRLDKNPKRSLDFNLKCIKVIGESDNPLDDIKALYRENGLRIGDYTINKIKTAIKPKRFYKSYITQVNRMIDTGKIKYKGNLYNYDPACRNIMFFYYLLRLAVKNDIPGRRWDRKLGVVKTDE